MLIMVKPDGVERRLVGAIVLAAERAGHDLIQARRRTLTPFRAKHLYKEHWGKEWFEDNLNYIISGDVVALWFTGARNDDLVRELRDQYALDFRRNTVHCSADLDAEIRERPILFL